MAGGGGRAQKADELADKLAGRVSQKGLAAFRIGDWLYAPGLDTRASKKETFLGV